MAWGLSEAAEAPSLSGHFCACAAQFCDCCLGPVLTQLFNHHLHLAGGPSMAPVLVRASLTARGTYGSRGNWA